MENGTAYFDSAVSYKCKMLMKSTTGIKINYETFFLRH